MTRNSIYQDMAERTDGSVYIAVVGPVRTGKSTFIQRMMEQVVIPNITNDYKRERARDELPQSASGRTIMTSEPKFVPEEAVEISPDGTAKLRVLYRQMQVFSKLQEPPPDIYSDGSALRLPYLRQRRYLCN